jgi:hypothetical protein
MPSPLSYGILQDNLCFLIDEHPRLKDRRGLARIEGYDTDYRKTQH